MMINWFENIQNHRGLQSIGVNDNSLFISRKIFKEMGKPKFVLIGYDENQRLILKVSDNGYEIKGGDKFYIRICSKPLARLIAQTFNWPTQTSRYTIAYKTEKENDLWIFSDWRRKEFKKEAK